MSQPSFRRPRVCPGERTSRTKPAAIRLRLTGLLLLAVAAFVAAGCSNKEAHKPVFPVRGRVLFEGKPTPHALVVFHPLGAEDNDAVRPRSQVGPDGTFTLTTYEAGDGAPAGQYRVTVELWLSTGNGDEGPTSRLPARYANPATSGLTATVNAGPTELQPFQLKR
jgi:hypothetical protein